MHPFVARIRPSLRTALVAWLVSRAIAWGAAVRAAWGGMPLLHAPSYGEGTPLWAGWVGLCCRLEEIPLGFGSGAGTWTLVIAGEFALFAAAAALYEFVRREDLPQTAERATWLWMLSPVMAVTLPVSSWNFAIAGLAIGVASLRSRRFWVATIATAAAIGFRAEAVLIWPGFVWMAFRRYRPGKDGGFGLWSVVFGPLAAFSGTVAAGILFAGRAGISLRTLLPDASWRTEWVWRGWWAELPTVAVGVAAAVGLVLLLRAIRRDHGLALLAAGPFLVWPLLHEPASAAAGTLAFAVPAFAVLARNLENPSLERPIAAAFAAGLVLWLVC